MGTGEYGFEAAEKGSNEVAEKKRQGQGGKKEFSMEDFLKRNFRLKNIGDESAIRFLEEDESKSILTYKKHTIQTGTGFRHPACWGTGCPFCKKGNKQRTSILMNIIDKRDNLVKIFEINATTWGWFVAYKRRLKKSGKPDLLSDRDFVIAKASDKGDFNITYDDPSPLTDDQKNMKRWDLSKKASPRPVEELKKMFPSFFEDDEETPSSPPFDTNVTEVKEVTEDLPSDDDLFPDFDKV